MSGSCAGLIGTVRNLESFHRELAEGRSCSISLCDVDRKNRGTLARRAATCGNPIPAGGPEIEGRRPPERRSRPGGHHRMSVSMPWEESGRGLGGKPGHEERRYPGSVFQVEPRPLFRSAAARYGQDLLPVGAFVDFPVSRNELGFPTGFRTMTSPPGPPSGWRKGPSRLPASWSPVSARAHRGPQSPELRRGGGHPHRYDHPGSTCTKSSPPSSGLFLSPRIRRAPSSGR